MRNSFQFYAILLRNRSNLVESFNYEEESNRNEIFTISQRCNSNDKSKIKEENFCLNTLDSKLKAPFEENYSTLDNGRLNHVTNFSSESVNVSKDDRVEGDVTSFCIKKKRAEILDDLILSVEEEMRYLQLFAHFNFLENSRYEESYLYTSDMVDHEMILQRIMKLSAGNSSLDRCEMRREKLKRLKISLNDENNYQTCLNELIDIEEEFIDDERN